MKKELDKCADPPVAAVIVFYLPDSLAIDNLRKIALQFNFVVVVCNSEFEPEKYDLSTHPNISFIANSKNKGLGTALNQGVHEVISLGFSLVCTFDQDTIIFSNFRSVLIETYVELKKRYHIGIVAPEYTDGNSSKTAYDGNDNGLITAAVQSGCLFTAKCLEICGEFRDDFFIEGIDTEFCLRAWSNGFAIGCCGTPIMEHGAGSKDVRRFLWREVVVTHHSAARLHLQYRNFAFTCKLYASLRPAWAASSCISMLKKYLLVLAFENQRFQKSKAMLHGIFVGLMTKSEF